jgi:hypothetical protein
MSLRRPMTCGVPNHRSSPHAAPGSPLQTRRNTQMLAAELFDQPVEDGGMNQRRRPTLAVRRPPDGRSKMTL